LAPEIKVAMITRDYPPDIGGIATYVSNLATHLRRHGIRVDVYRGGADGRTAVMGAARSLRAGDYDVLHMQSLPYGALAAFHPLVVTVHSPVLEESKYYRSANKAKVPAAFLFEKATLMKADAVIAVSRTTVSHLEKNYGVNPKKIELIHDGVDCKKFNPSGKSWGGETRILMCSRLEPRKNIDAAISAFGSIGDGPFKVEVIGEGPDRAELEAKAAAAHKEIAFRGAVAQGELEKNFSRAHVFVSTSLSEGFGLSILQAMAAGCAVVASDIPSHRELIESGREGLLYSDQSELTEAIRRVHSDHGLARRLGEGATKKAQGYSWIRVARATADVYGRLLAQVAHRNHLRRMRRMRTR
jgi:glycosyltransferase involved in cell wall biosynthesis